MFVVYAKLGTLLWKVREDQLSHFSYIAVHVLLMHRYELKTFPWSYLTFCCRIQWNIYIMRIKCLRKTRRYCTILLS
jgi:hypothetical protein